MSQPTPDIASLVAEVRAVVRAARTTVERQVNVLVVLTNFEVGRRIVVHDQGGEDRAEYGKAVLQSLSQALTAEFGRGWSVDNLALIRRFYLAYRDRLPTSQASAAIAETPSRISGGGKSETLSRISAVFTLSWSHYVSLLSHVP